MGEAVRRWKALTMPEYQHKNELSHVRQSRSRRQIIEAIQARINARRTAAEKIADWLVKWFGTVSFVFFNFAAFAVWVIINLGLIPGIEPFDPYPFVLLITIVSIEAIFLAVFVLISQNRESKINDLRQEIDVYVNTVAEQETTKAIRLIARIMRHLNIPYESDPELREMMKPLDTEEMQKELERQLGLPHREKENY